MKEAGVDEGNRAAVVLIAVPLQVRGNVDAICVVHRLGGMMAIDSANAERQVRMFQIFPRRGMGVPLLQGNDLGKFRSCKI